MDISNAAPERAAVSGQGAPSADGPSSAPEVTSAGLVGAVAALDVATSALRR